MDKYIDYQEILDDLFLMRPVAVVAEESNIRAYFVPIMKNGKIFIASNSNIGALSDCLILGKTRLKIIVDTMEPLIKLQQENYDETYIMEIRFLALKKLKFWSNYYSQEGMYLLPLKG